MFSSATAGAGAAPPSAPHASGDAHNDGDNGQNRAGDTALEGDKRPPRALQERAAESQRQLSGGQAAAEGGGNVIGGAFPDRLSVLPLTCHVPTLLPVAMAK